MLGLILFIYGFIEYKRKNYYSFYVIFFLFVTNGYQIIPDSILLLPAAGITKSFDYASFLILSIIVTEYSAFMAFMKKYKVYTLPLSVLFICCAADFLFSKFVFGYSWNSVIRTFRNYFFLICPFLFIKTDIFKDKKFMKLLIIITIIQGILYLSQILFHTVLIKNAISGEVHENVLDDLSYTRYYNLPAFLIPSLITLFYFKIWSTKSHQNIAIAILVMVILGSLHRNLILTIFPVVLIFRMIFNRGRNVALLAIVPVAFLILLVTPVVGDRINQGFDQISGAVSDASNVQSSISQFDNTETNTSTYRYLHFMERYLYITSDASLMPFGLGMLTEDSPEAKKLNFKVGVVAADSTDYRPKQIDTADVAWSAVIVTTGFIGLLVMLYFIYYYLRLLYKHRFFATAKIMMIYITILVLISFFGTDIISVPFRALFGFLLCVLIKSINYTPNSIHENKRVSIAI